MAKYFFASVARIAKFSQSDFTLEPQPRDRWQTGDYVVGEVFWQPGSLSNIELISGREANVTTGDCVVGALGRRSATLQAVGDWREVKDDLRLEALTAAGVFGRCTSKSSFIPPLMQLDYRGHVMLGGKALKMRDCVQQIKHKPASTPIILIIGTSMDSGKTLSAKVIIRLLKARGLRVAGIKFTGVGRYKDILAMGDAGADTICDFVDAGLPSTCCDNSEYKGVIDHLLGSIADQNIDIVVGEAGASPLEPYNGEIVAEELSHQVVCTVLCASDPYAVVGVMSAFGTHPDFIAGRAACTTAGRQLVEKLCGVKALDLMNRESLPELEKRLAAVIEQAKTHPVTPPPL